MLTNSYIHIPYVGYITERKIWEAGIKDWYNFNVNKLDLPNYRKEHIKKFVDLSIACLKKGNYRFFSSYMPKHEQWRCLSDFSKVAYLDIETTGLDRINDDITLIGVFDGKKVKSFVKGKDFLSFRKYISSFPVIVTFNGSLFDLPFLSQKFGMKFDQLHIDLRFAFYKLGIRGGLKRIEKRFQLKRSEETEGLNGLDAIRLWYKYVNGDNGALELLKEYNAEDIVGLKVLANKVYNMLEENLKLQTFKN